MGQSMANKMVVQLVKMNAYLLLHGQIEKPDLKSWVQLPIPKKPGSIHNQPEPQAPEFGAGATPAGKLHRQHAEDFLFLHYCIITLLHYCIIIPGNFSARIRPSLRA